MEKALKALVVERNGETPPKTHNLIYLLKLCEAKLSESQIRFITRLNTAAVATRYPDELKMLIEQYPHYSFARVFRNAILETMRDYRRCAG